MPTPLKATPLTLYLRPGLPPPQSASKWIGFDAKGTPYLLAWVGEDDTALGQWGGVWAAWGYERRGGKVQHVFRPLRGSVQDLIVSCARLPDNVPEPVPVLEGRVRPRLKLTGGADLPMPA